MAIHERLRNLNANSVNIPITKPSYNSNPSLLFRKLFGTENAQFVPDSLQLESANKFFSSCWLDNDSVLLGSKCGKLIKYKISSFGTPESECIIKNAPLPNSIVEKLVDINLNENEGTERNVIQAESS